MSATTKMVGALRECLVPLTSRELSIIGGIERRHVAGYLARSIKRGEVRRVSPGVYEAGDGRTLTQVTDIEVAKNVRPVVPDGRKVELKPQQGHRTVNLLLEAIARSDDPKPYAGVVREIGDLLATS